MRLKGAYFGTAGATQKSRSRSRLHMHPHVNRNLQSSICVATKSGVYKDTVNTSQLRKLKRGP